MIGAPGPNRATVVFPQLTAVSCVLGRGVWRAVQTTSIGSLDAVTTFYDGTSANSRIIGQLFGDVIATAMRLDIELDNGLFVVTIGTAPMGLTVITARIQ